MAFDSDTRNLLARIVGECREILAEDVEAQLQSRYGLYPDGRVLEIAQTPGEQQAAGELKDLLDHLTANEPHQGKKKRDDAIRRAYRRMVREIGFTLLNRLAALRLGEERGIVVECVGQGMASAGSQLYDRIADGGLGNRYQTYRAFLEGLFDELAIDLGVLFDRDTPHSRVFPGESALIEVLARLNDAELVERNVWEQDETIGWIYQYYNDPDERKAMRKASSAPRNSRELAVRNQFFTPRYVVEFLTDNTLGRLWYEMCRGDTRLVEECRYLVRRPKEVFLTDEHTDGWSQPIRRGIRQVTEGDFGNLPRQIEWDEFQCLALMIDGYEVAEQLWGEEYLDVASERYQHYRQTGRWQGSSLELWLNLFFLQRDWHSPSGPPDRETLQLLSDLYTAWRETIEVELSGEDDQEPAERPVYIPVRALKDPRDIKLLDPACGSMHFGLYAFDLFMTIYDEAWKMGLIKPEEFGYRPEPLLLHETVQPDPESAPISTNSGKTIDFDDAYIVITREGDFGDGIDADRPYLVSSSERFRVPYDYRVKLDEFDYQDALEEGHFSEAGGERLVRDSGAFTFDELPAVGQEEAYRDFRRKVPGLIIRHNLHGIDIDPRAVQIANLSLWLRAQRAYQELALGPAQRPIITRSNVVTAEPMPGDSELMEEFLGTLGDENLAQLVRFVFERMQLADQAGSLLKIEQELRTKIARMQEEQDPFRTKGLDYWSEAEKKVLAALERYATWASNGKTTRRRLFAEDAGEGFAFIDVCRYSFDIVVMNPPFGESPRPVDNYLSSNYPHTKNDLFAAFCQRSIELSGSDGLIGEISSRVGFFIKSFESWRREILGNTNIETILDLGTGVLDDATVEAACFVLAKPRNHDFTEVIRLLIDNDKASALSSALNGFDDQKRFLLNRNYTDRLPLAPFVYWISSQTMTALTDPSSLEPAAAVVRQGLGTGNNDRFLRTVWEVPPDGIAGTSASTPTDVRESFSSGKRWAYHVRAGSSQPWYSPLTLVIDWENQGSRLKSRWESKGETPSRYIPSEDLYFRSGFSWTLRAFRFIPYLIPVGCIPSASRYMAFPHDGKDTETLGICASNITTAFTRFYGEMFERPKHLVDTVKKIPFVQLSKTLIRDLDDLITNEVRRRRDFYRNHEPFVDFTVPAIIHRWVPASTSTWNPRTFLGERLECLIAEAYSLSEEQLRELEFDLEEAIQVRRKDAEEDNEETGEVDVDTSDYGQTVALVSYVVGCVFGRWDIRFALNPDLAPKLPQPLAPPPACPPGMLINPDGLPATSGKIASEAWLRARPDANLTPPEGTVAQPVTPDSDYPLTVSWKGVLVDDPGTNYNNPHRNDIIVRIRTVFRLLWPENYQGIEAEACEILGVSTLRDYFRLKTVGFFADHLKQYSKSRRKAPIYWPLSTEAGSYTVWLYYPRLTDETLYTVVNSYVEPKIQQLERHLVGLESDIENASRQEAAGVRDKIDQIRAFLSELRAFRDELLRIAGLPYKPNLNDGVIINAAPLHRLFPYRKWQKATEKVWKRLEAGECDWAHMAYNLWPERVREACRKDKSIAIAHGLEELYGEEAGSTQERSQSKRKGVDDQMALDLDESDES